MINFILKKIFNKNARLLRKYQKICELVNIFEPKISKLSNQEITEYSNSLKNRSKNETLDDLLPEAFALFRESSKRAINIRHYDVQIIGAIALHNGSVAEMKTGEGKTNVAPMAAYLNCLSGKNVHIITVNDYLVERDSKINAKVFEMLDISYGYVTSECDENAKREMYAKDIVYISNTELGFDYLRDNMKYKYEDMHTVKNGLNFAIIDEGDSILIDEARTPLIISGPGTKDPNLYKKINAIALKIDVKLLEIDEKNSNITLTHEAIDFCEKCLIEKNIIAKDTSLYDVANGYIINYINQSLKAHHLLKKNKDYIVHEKEIKIIDEFRGRIMEGRRYSDGLHQAIEAKENLKIQEENQTLASITYQNLFRMYDKISAMTGTALTEEEEFNSIYNINVISIPTYKKIIRKDLNDIVFYTEKQKIQNFVEKIKNEHSKGRPILISTPSIEKSEYISKILKKESIKHKVLNAKQHKKEAKIIQEAGRINSVTIATNMAGRGTDIKLGGDLNIKLENVTDEEKKNQIIQAHKEEEDNVKSLNGLLIIGTERHENRRIDNQLIGRSGRQGDPGETQFFLSLEDDLLRKFGGERLQNILKKIGFSENEKIDHPMINNSIKRAQKTIENMHYEIRKNLLKYDEVMNIQRQIFYKKRSEIIKKDELQDELMILSKEIIEREVNSQNLKNNDLNLSEIINELEGIFSIKLNNCNENIDKYQVIKNIYKQVEVKIINKIETNKDKSIKKIIKDMYISIMDFFWKEHLASLDSIKDSVQFRSYGNKNPFDEYQSEAYQLFIEMQNGYKLSILKNFSHMIID